MMEGLVIINGGVVGVFGAILSAAFSGVKWTKREKAIFGAAILLMLSAQLALILLFDAQTLRLWYPVVTHLPLVLLLRWLSGRWLWSICSVLTAYLCCQFMRWAALLCVAVFAGGDMMQAAAELAVTLPLLFLLLRYAAPGMRGLARQPFSLQIQFSVLPAVSYGFDYLTRVYTDWLVQGIPAAVEFMPFVCAAAYLAFVLHITAVLRRQHEWEQMQTVYDLQAKQAAQQIAQMHKSQEQAAAYRHDLRHHLQYLSACIDAGEMDQARGYISSLHDDLTRQTVSRYCENTTANLILAVYAQRAEEAGISMEVRVQMAPVIRMADSDLTVLLSNALENALNACAGIRAQGGEAHVEVRGYESRGRTFLEIANTCTESVAFADGVPVTEEKGHGFGVRSICSVMERCGGLYSFTVENGRFILRLSV